MNIGRKALIRTIVPCFTAQNALYNVARPFSFKSAFSLEKLYPKSSLMITTPEFVPESPDEKFSGYIPINALEIKTSRSSGPGGQGVNTCNSKVDVRFHVKSAKWLHEDLKDKLLEKYYTKVNKEGFLIIKSELTRSRQLNIADSLEKLRTMIRSVAAPPAEPSPESQERKRLNLLKGARQRLHEKRLNTMKKGDRGSF